MKAHKHAALMAEYAKDAAETEQPWRRWEVADLSGDFRDCIDQPVWICHMQYRRKAQTININGFEVPEPMRLAPEIGTDYVVVSLSHERGYFVSKWYNETVDIYRMQQGIIHITYEAAEIHAKALLSFTARERKEGA